MKKIIKGFPLSFQFFLEFSFQQKLTIEQNITVILSFHNQDKMYVLSKTLNGSDKNKDIK